VNEPRLVATDLDGTLVRSDGTISERTREVITAVEARGVPVVFVTGRPLRWAAEVFDHVGDHGLAVVSNGALVWDVGADRARLRREIDPATVLGVCAELRAAVPGSTFAIETLEGIGLEPEFLERHPVPDGARRGPLDELVTAPVVKLLARHEELGPQEFWDAAEAAIGDQVTITWSSSSTLLEISAFGVTKATTLALQADELGIAPEEVLAFGDMPNDLPMLAWAGTAYAMGNAHASVLAAVDLVAPSNDEDGVAQVLAGIFDL
jgi:hydroxymethylpyrimidine pyrophosphatase-like HAD family hydrolase